MSASASATEQKLGKFTVQDLMTSLDTGRVMYNEKECQGEWNLSGSKLDEKTKNEFKTRLKEGVITAGGIATISSTSSSSQSSSSSNTGFSFSAFAKFNSSVSSSQSSTTNINQTTANFWHMPSKTLYSLSITSLAPNQQPILNGAESAAAPASAAAKPSK